MTRDRFFFATIGCVLWSTVFIFQSPCLGAAEVEDGHTDASLFCGPRSAQRVLAIYGIRENVFDLARELSLREDGTSLASIGELLARRGIESLPIELGTRVGVCSEYPTIVYLRPTSAEETGHFVVLEKSSATHALVWDGGYSLDPAIQRRLASRTTLPIALVTHPRHAPDPAEFIRKDRRVDVVLIGVGLCVVVAFSLVMQRRSVKRTHFFTKEGKKDENV